MCELENSAVQGEEQTEQETAVCESVAEAETETVAEVEDVKAEETSTEIAEAVSEAAVPEPIAEEAPTEEAAQPAKKKSRRGLKIFLVIFLVLFVLAVGVFSFLLGRNSDFDPVSGVVSCFTGEKEQEAPEFVGMWSSDEHTFYVSAGGMVEIDGVGYSYTWDKKHITIENAEGETYAIRYRKTSNSIKLWLDGEKDDSVSLRLDSKSKPDKLCGSWVLGEGEMLFGEDGSATIYGAEYTYTADSYEIACKSKHGTEYMFYVLDGDFLTVWLPGDPQRKLTFTNDDSLLSELVGIWVDEDGYDYMIFYSDGAVAMGDFYGMSVDDYAEYGLTMYVEGDELVLSVSGYTMRMDIYIDGSSMELSAYGESSAYYKVSDDVNLTEDEIQLYWEMFSPTEAA